MPGAMALKNDGVHTLLGTAIIDGSGEIIDYTGVTTTTTGDAEYKQSPFATFQAIVKGTGAVTATVVIDCSNNIASWNSTPLGTITLQGTTVSADGFTTSAPWRFIRARVTAISGTGAQVTVLMGV